MPFDELNILEATIDAIKDSTGMVVSPAKKSVIKREITAVQKDTESISKDTTITQMAVIEEQRDVDTISEEKIIPPNRTAMWVFFSIALVALMGAAAYVKIKFF